MPRINPVEPDQASKKSAALLEGVNKAKGRVPNILATMAHSSAALESYFGLAKAISGASLSAATREQIALAIAAENGCEYCTSAHTAAGKAIGIDADELARGLVGESSDPKIQAAVRFSLAINEKRGFVSDEDLAEFKAAGFGDGEVAEVIAVVALNLYTNYINHVAQTEVDFPLVTIPEKATA